MTDEKRVRKPPVGAVFALHKPLDRRGWCNWCGEPVTETTGTRGWLRWWHDGCEGEYHIIIRPDAARRAVFKRDEGICADCGEDWSERVVLRKNFEVSCQPDGLWDIRKKADREEAMRVYHAERAEGYWRYTDLVEISLWHVDHHIPLWKVAHLPDIQRIEYFKLANLITRCEPCHKRKSKREAAERGKFNRLAKGGDANGPDNTSVPGHHTKMPAIKEKRSRALPSRPFTKAKKKWPKRSLRQK